MTDRPNMSRDAKIVTARRLEAECNERIQFLAERYGILVPDEGKMFLKLDAFMRILLTDDQWVDLELAYLDRVKEMLDAQEGPAKEAAARARLQVPDGYGGQPNRQQRRHPG